MRKPLSKIGELPGSNGSASLTYSEARLFCEDVSLELLADKFGTPLYVYSRAELENGMGAYLTATEELASDSLVCYAVKANGNLALLRIIAASGLGADVTSKGELFLALEAGFKPEKIVFSGVGKTESEIRYALENRIRAIHIESEAEFELAAGLAKHMAVTCPVAVRVNPDIAVSTHKHVSTGRHFHKFGVTPSQALNLLEKAGADDHMEALGLAIHLGSQIKELEPYISAMTLLKDLGRQLRSKGVDLRYLDVGGGLAVDYGGGGAPSVSELVSTMSSISDEGYELVIEPGRSIIASAGLLLTTVLYEKKTPERHFIIVDAGMNDLLRPALYGAVHPILPVSRHFPQDEERYEVADMVGPVCETGDTIVSNARLPLLQSGDRVAITMAGAYGYAMSSNYNGRLKPAEVLVDKSGFQIIRRRQQLIDLITDIP